MNGPSRLASRRAVLSPRPPKVEGNQALASGSAATASGINRPHVTLRPARVSYPRLSNADRLIAQAREVETRETREADSAQRLADRALEVERRQEGRGRADPEAQRELRSERAVVAGTQQAAARESREAAAAVEAARVLADRPAQPLPIGLVQTDALGNFPISIVVRPLCSADPWRP